MEENFTMIKMDKSFHITRDSVVKVYRYDPRWKLCMCNTGPQALTATVRSLMLAHEVRFGNLQNFSFRVVRKDFEEYGGIYKVEYERLYDRPSHKKLTHNNSTNSSRSSSSSSSNESGYYMHTMNKKKTPCLASYSPVNAAVLEGKAITLDNRAMYLVKDGKKRPFPNYDTFLAMKYDVHYVTRLEATEFNAIPTGEELPSLE